MQNAGVLQSALSVPRLEHPRHSSQGLLWTVYRALVLKASTRCKKLQKLFEELKTNELSPTPKI